MNKSEHLSRQSLMCGQYVGVEYCVCSLAVSVKMNVLLYAPSLLLLLLKVLSCRAIFHRPVCTVHTRTANLAYVALDGYLRGWNIQLNSKNDIFFVLAGLDNCGCHDGPIFCCCGAGASPVPSFDAKPSKWL